MIKKTLHRIKFISAIIITLTISACSTTKEREPIKKQQAPPQQPVLTTVIISPPVTPSVSDKIVSRASLSELTDFFETLHYNRNHCVPGDCEIPRITFNKVSKDWKKTARKLPITIKKELFFNLMTPLILIANESINNERDIVKNSALNSPALKNIALKYRVIKNDQDHINEQLRQILLQRVDILPPSLALAQAAEESGWATSRFAIEGNAFFGQWDYSGKGMKPLRQRTSLGNYGVARFSSPLASVEAYMLNINRNRAYQQLRTLRAQLRIENKPISGDTLATTMDKYSERGQAYIKGLRATIRYNKLEPLDQAYLSEKQTIQIIIH